MLNMEYSKIKNYLKIKAHNERQSKIDYLKSESEKKYGDNIQKTFSSVEEIVEKRKKQMKKRASIRKNENEICEFVCAFSEEQFKNCSKEEVFEKLSSLMEKIKKQYGLEPLDLSFHLDEGKDESTNVHAHLVFYNFDFEKNKSALRKMKKSDFSKMQDLVGDHFSNLNFQRGKRKSETQIKHSKPQEYKQVQETLKEMEKFVEDFEKEKKDFEKEKKEQVEFLKILRDEIMEAKKQKDLILEEKKTIEKDLKEIRINLDLLRKKANNTTETILKDSKNGFGMFDSKKLKSKVSSAIYAALKLNTKLDEVEKMKEKVEILEKQNETLFEEKKEVVEISKKQIEETKKENVGLKKEIELLQKKVEVVEEKNKILEINLKNEDFLNEKLQELKKQETNHHRQDR